MTDEEHHLKKFTHRNLQKLSNWPEWDECFDAQLDAHHASGAMLPHVPRPFATAGGEPPNILHTHWNNVVKPEGEEEMPLLS
jgi:hypothetical protein